jgi:NAD(P) transhydrogenase subunit beta
VSQQGLQLAYLAASVLFILALRWLSSPPTARRGVLAGEIGMAVAVVATLLRNDIVSYQWIAVGLLVGASIGTTMAVFMPMTAMPQRIALSHAFGALAAALVGTAEFYLRSPRIGGFTMAALGLEVLLGFLTFTGSLMAFGKLQEILPQRPILYRGQNLINLALLAASVGLVLALIIDPGHKALFPILMVVALVVGVLIVVPIGGADMPVVISLLNSYAGLSGAAMGFVLGNTVLIVAGALDGSSGFFLSLIMSRAMNRSFRNVLFGGFGQLHPGGGAGGEDRTVRSTSPDEVAEILRDAASVIVVPGYGLAVARAQQKVRELYDVLSKQGVDVKFAIHPVAGRMPGHMNVLLAEADIPYELLFDMDEINPEFATADVALVVGANDVTNPAARTDPSSPIYGMPILDVDHARTVIVIKRSMNPGFAGIDNPLYYEDHTLMLFGDAREAMTSLVSQLSSEQAKIG